MSRQRIFVLVAIALVLVAMVDFLNRVYVPRKDEVRAASSFVPAAVRPPVPAAQIRQDLATWLPRLHPIAEGQGPATEQDWALVLLAVFDDRGTRFGVVRATPSAGGNPKVVRVIEGDALYGYKVSRVEPLRVVLTGGVGDKELRLFEPSGQAVGAKGRAGLEPASPPGSGASVPSSQVREGQAAAGGDEAGKPATQPARGVSPPGAPPSSGPKAVATQELKPGQAFELPESMRGLKVVGAPVPATQPTGPAASKPAAPPQPSKKP